MTKHLWTWGLIAIAAACNGGEESKDPCQDCGDGQMCLDVAEARSCVAIPADCTEELPQTCGSLLYSELSTECSDALSATCDGEGTAWSQEGDAAASCVFGSPELLCE